MIENPRRGRQAGNFTTNVPKILDLKSSSGQIFSENSRWVPLANAQWYCYSELFTFMYNTLWSDVLKYPVLQDEGDNYFSILMQLC